VKQNASLIDCVCSLLCAVVLPLHNVDEESASCIFARVLEKLTNFHEKYRHCGWWRCRCFSKCNFLISTFLLVSS